MKSFLTILISSSFLIYSCEEDTVIIKDNFQYPITFRYHRSAITYEKAFHFEDNESYTEIDPKSGNLDLYRDLAAENFYDYVRSLGFPISGHPEYFVFLHKDTIRINQWGEGAPPKSSRINADLKNVNGKIIDEKFFGTTVIWDTVKHEIKFCIAYSLGLIAYNGRQYRISDYRKCKSNLIDEELEHVFLQNNEYQKNDTLGIYFIDMIYKEQ